MKDSPRKVYRYLSGEDFVELDPFTRPGIIHRRYGDGTYGKTPAHMTADWYLKEGTLTLKGWEGVLTIEEDPY